MALLRKQADLVRGGFYILEEPNRLLKRFLVGSLAGEEVSKSAIIGQFKAFDLKDIQFLGPPVFIFDEAELKAFLVTGSHGAEASTLALTEVEKGSYLKTFKHIKNKMKKTDLQKAVLYTKLEQCLEDFPSVEAFTFLMLAGLRNKKSGYLFGFYNPFSQKALLGCSPEFIFKTTEDGGLITTAVAGTQKTSTDLQWSSKLKLEHKLVMDGVSERLKNRVSWGNVENFSYGDLSHLKAEGLIEKSLNSEDLSELLHPTPAVGTLPHKYFNEIKLGPEGRGYFGGYVEVLSFERSFSLVTIRCFEWSAAKVQICIGGGVLKESLAEKEWIELEDKWNIFKNMWEV